VVRNAIDRALRKWADQDDWWESPKVTLLDVARSAHLNLRELAAITGLHAATIKACIHRAVGPTTIDFDQPELPLDEIGAAPSTPASPRAARLPNLSVVPSPGNPDAGTALAM